MGPQHHCRQRMPPIMGRVSRTTGGSSTSGRKDFYPAIHRAARCWYSPWVRIATNRELDLLCVGATAPMVLAGPGADTCAATSALQAIPASGMTPPANRGYYHYNYYLDNCSTRVRDADRSSALGGTAQARSSTRCHRGTRGAGRRGASSAGTCRYTPVINLALGHPVDTENDGMAGHVPSTAPA